jgi:hypothetical protein
VAVREKCKELNCPVTLGVQKQLRLLWIRRKQINEKSIGNAQSKLGGSKDETQIMIHTITPVVQEIGDVNRIAGRAATIMSEIALPGHRR